MNTKFIAFLISLVLLISLIGCSAKQKKEQATIGDANYTEVKYAKGFTIRNYDGYKLIDVQDPSGENTLKYHYALIQKGAEIDSKIPEEYEKIAVPIQNVICMTSLQISNFIKLGIEDKIVGITSTRFLFSEEINRQLKEKRTYKIGIEGDFDSELVIALDPDVILVSPFKKGGYEVIKNLGIPLVSFLGYKEVTPLGQAEWIKFTASFFGLEDQAQNQFNEIEKKYLDLKKSVEDIEQKPTVMSGELHSGNWYVVGGKSYLARLFNDAGAKYFMDNDNESGGFYQDFEAIYAQGAHADYWRILNSFNGEFTYEVLKKSDSRYADFDAFKNRKVIYCNLRDVPFYERTTVEPEVVLADLIKIFHPSVLPDHKPVYYYLLK